MLNNKEIKLIIDKFIDKCMKINSEIGSKGFRNMAECIISSSGLDKHLVVRALNYEVLKMKRNQHIPLKPTKVKAISIDEFIGRNVDSELLSEIRSAFKGLEQWQS